jgi:hypothetical protein
MAMQSEAISGSANTGSAELSWTRSIPIVNNRYMLIHWGWACLLFGGIFTVVFAAGAAAFAPGTSYSLDTLVRIYVVLLLVISGAILGLGLFGALSVGNKLTAHFTLNAQGAKSDYGDYSQQISSLARLFGEKGSNASSTAGTAEMMLLQSGYYEWKDIRGATFDAQRSVITLHRGWHRKLLLFATAENYQQVSALVQSHVTPRPAAAPRPTPAA